MCINSGPSAAEIAARQEQARREELARQERMRKQEEERINKENLANKAAQATKESNAAIARQSLIRGITDSEEGSKKKSLLENYG